MMATVPHVTSGLGLKFKADGFLLTRVYQIIIFYGIVFKKAAYQKLTKYVIHETLYIFI